MNKITITKTQQTLLSNITNASTSPQRLVRRANLILVISTTGSNQFATARQTGYARDTVHKWLLRWRSAYDELEQLEAEHAAGRLSKFKYTRALTTLLDDAPRPGHPTTFSEEQKQRIIALASEKPEKEGVPIDAWTHSTLQIAVIDKGIVPSISVAHVGRFLKEGNTAAS